MCSDRDIQQKKFNKLMNDYVKGKYDRFKYHNPDIIVFIKDNPIKKNGVNISLLDLVKN